MYSTTEPRDALLTRIKFCVKLRDDASHAMRYPEHIYVKGWSDASRAGDASLDNGIRSDDSDDNDDFDDLL